MRETNGNIIYHDSVRVHDGMEAVSNGQYSAVFESFTNCFLNKGIRPEEQNVIKEFTEFAQN